MYGCPPGVLLSSSMRRLGAHLLDGILCLVTCVIGWLVWSLVIYGRGQSPAKQLLGMRVVIMTAGVRAGWGRMFVREHLVKPLIGILVGWLLIPYLWLLWDRNRQELWDKMLDTVVVDDPSGLVGNVPQGAWPQGQMQAPPAQPQLPAAPWDAPTVGMGQPGGYGQGQPQEPYGQPGGSQGGGYGQPGGQGGYPPYPPPPPPRYPPRQ
jgi:uncharacterized RDD family membrane protein YckC